MNIVYKFIICTSVILSASLQLQAQGVPGNEIKVRTSRGQVCLSTPEDVMVNDPGFYDKSLFRGRNITYYGRWTYKLEQAQRLGAAGCLIIHNEPAAGYGWHVCVNGHQEGNLALFDEATGNSDELGMRGWLNEKACRRLFEMSGLDYDKAGRNGRCYL